MSNSDWITIWGIAITFFVTMIGSVWMLAFRIGGLTQRITSIEKTLEDLPRIKYSLGQLIVKVDVLWHHHLSKANSPIVLNEEGVRLLVESGVGAFAEHNYPEIISKVRALNPRNAYQAQEMLMLVLGEYQTIEECKLKLQDETFSSGSDVASLLFVAALSIRDRVILELGFGK